MRMAFRYQAPKQIRSRADTMDSIRGGPANIIIRYNIQAEQCSRSLRLWGHGKSANNSPTCGGRSTGLGVDGAV